VITRGISSIDHILCQHMLWQLLLLTIVLTLSPKLKILTNLKLTCGINQVSSIIQSNVYLTNITCSNALTRNNNKHRVQNWWSIFRFSLELTKKLLKFYENFFELEFPLKKLTIVAVPNSNGALENWGLIFLG